MPFIVTSDFVVKRIHCAETHACLPNNGNNKVTCIIERYTLIVRKISAKDWVHCEFTQRGIVSLSSLSRISRARVLSLLLAVCRSPASDIHFKSTILVIYHLSYRNPTKESGNVFFFSFHCCSVSRAVIAWCAFHLVHMNNFIHLRFPCHFLHSFVRSKWKQKFTEMWKWSMKCYTKVKRNNNSKKTIVTPKINLH